MIQLALGGEPPNLAAIRDRELPRVAAIAAQGVRLTGSEIGRAYQEMKAALHERQHQKCAYCEMREQAKRNDVEHFRPKTKYWWLAWTWENLVFACRNCNQAPYKLDQFPLALGSIPLQPQQQPPGQEQPLLLDPRTDSGVRAIQFVPADDGRWWPRARSGSARGQEMIRVCGLDRPDLLDQYAIHVRTLVKPAHDRIHLAEQQRTQSEIWHREIRHLLSPSMPFVGLSYDALDFFFPEAWRPTHQLTLPRPL